MSASKAVRSGFDSYHLCKFSIDFSLLVLYNSTVAKDKGIPNMEDILDSLCDKLEIPYDKENRGYSVPLIILALISAKTAKEAALIIGCPDRTLSRILIEEFPSLRSSEKWRSKFLHLLDNKMCNKCNFIGSRNLFVSNGSNLCKKCDSTRAICYRAENIEEAKVRSHLHYLSNKSDYLARNAQRKALKLKATPPWADLEKIKEIYRTCPKDYHVDHIIPLQGELVCGLHVETNLRHLPALENLQKHNKFTGE